MQRRVRLFIGGMEVEFTSTPDILYNFQVDSLTEPTAIKNSYSKTITIPGTKNNDRVFDNFFLNDYRTQGMNFDASKKTQFTIYVDSDIFETGYCKLNKIVNNKHYHAFEILLYGGIGELYYNLDMSDNPNGSDEKRKISDLQFYDTSGNPIDIGFTINKETVAEAWSSVTDDSQYSVISFAPAYNGLPSDFDADKVLMNVGSVTATGNTGGAVVRRPGGRGSVVTTAVTSGDSTYTTYGGYALATLSREYTGAEMREFRSYLQRPVLSVRRTLEAIANPNNNGGYEVEFDSDWAKPDNPYWQDLYVTLPMLTTLEYNAGIVSSATTVSLGAKATGSTAYSTTKDPTYYEDRLTILSDSDSGYAFDVQVKVTLDVEGVSDTTNDKLVLCAYPNYAGAFIVQLVAYDGGGNPVAGSDEYYATSAYGIRRVSQGGRSQIYTNFIERNAWNYQAPYGDGFVRASSPGYFEKVSGSTYRWDEEITLTAKNVPAGSTLKILVTDLYKNSNTPNSSRILYYRLEQGGQATQYYSRSFNNYNLTINSSKVAYKTNEGIRTGASFTKKQLLDTQYSPFEFLVSYMKIFGLYAIKDKVDKKVTILTRKNFFRRNEIVDIEKYVDRQSLNVTPLAFKHKWYSWNLKADESEYGKAYEDTYGKAYGQQKINTGYNFDRETEEVLKDNIFKNAVQVLERSDAFCYTGDDMTSKPWMFPGYSYLLYDTNDATDTYEVVVNPSSTIDAYSAFTAGYMYYDLYDKVQLHTADNSPADGSNVLLFRNGSVPLMKGTTSLNYYITDDNSYHNILNDSKPCWLFTNSETDAQGNSIATKVDEIPYFNRYLIYPATGYITRSLDFGTPEEIYVPNAIYRPGSTIYEEFWKDYISDLYSKDSRVVSTKMLIREKPSVDWLRRFYFFDNAIWRMTKISDYDVANDKLTTVEFVRVQDVNKYTSASVSSAATITITLSLDSVPNSGGTVQYSISISNGGNWYISSVDYDTTVSASAGTGDYTGTWTIPASNSTAEVQRTMVVNSDDVSVRVYLTQVGTRLSISGPLESGDVPWAGGTRTFRVISPDTNWSAKTDYTGIVTSITPSAGTPTDESGVTVTATIAQNDVEATRQAYLYVQNPNGLWVRSGYITQQAANGATITVTPSYKGNVDASGTTFTALVYCTEDWRNLGTYDWIVCSPTSGTSGTTQVTVTVSANDGSARLGNTYFYRGNTANNAGLTISQNANAGATISLDRNSWTTTYVESGTIMVNVTSSAPWNAYLFSADLLASPMSGASGTTQVTLTYTKNETGAERTLKVRFYIGQSPNGIYTEFTLTQGNTINYEKEYLSMDILSAGTISFNNNYTGATAPLYSTDGTNWYRLENTLNVLPGDRIMLKNNEVKYSNVQYSSVFSGSAYFNLEGNIMSMLYEDNFEGQDTLVSGWTFWYMFSGTNVVSCEHLVMPAVNLKNYCYYGMFRDCRRLITAPDLPATLVNDGAYGYMFYNCTSLNYIKCLMESRTSQMLATGSWMFNVAANGTFVMSSNSSSGVWYSGEDGVPNGWYVIYE